MVARDDVEARLSAEDLDGAVADHLVDIHVALSPAAGLKDDERKVLLQAARDDLVGRLRDLGRVVGRGAG